MLLLLIAPIALAAAILGLEFAARLWFRFAERYHVLMPGIRMRFILPTDVWPGLRSPISFFINREGERGDPPPRNKDGVYRVLVAGGSTIACGSLDSDRTVAAVLQEALRAPEALRVLGCRRVHVGNVAKSLIDSSGLRVILERVLPQYGHVDLLVIVCGQSDALRWLGEGAPDGQAAEPLATEECFLTCPSRQFGWAPRKSALAGIYRRAAALLRRTPREVRVGRMNLRDLRDRRQLAVFTPLTQDYSAVLRACEANFRAALQTARQYADRVIVGEVTGWPKDDFTAEEERGFWNGRIGAPSDTEEPRFVSTEDLFRLVRDVDSTVRGVAREAGVEYFPMRGLLESLPQPCYDHFHLTEEGARAVGLGLAATVLNRAPEGPPRPASRAAGGPA